MCNVSCNMSPCDSKTQSCSVSGWLRSDDTRLKYDIWSTVNIADVSEENWTWSATCSGNQLYNQTESGKRRRGREFLIMEAFRWRNSSSPKLAKTSQIVLTILCNKHKSVVEGRNYKMTICSGLNGSMCLKVWCAERLQEEAKLSGWFRVNQTAEWQQVQDRPDLNKEQWLWASTVKYEEALRFSVSERSEVRKPFCSVAKSSSLHRTS